MEIGIYTITGSIAAVSSAALARFAVGPSFNKERSKWVQMELGDHSIDRGSFERVVLEYEAREGWVTKKAKTLVYVKRAKGAEAIAISANCTHLGCIVTWDEGQQIFKCPCHDGRYDAEGQVISGPPSAPLRRHPARVEAGKIIINTDAVSFGGDTGEPV